MTSLADDLLKGADEIADFLGVSRRQVYHLVHEHNLPSFKVGAAIWARKSRILSWIETRESLVDAEADSSDPTGGHSRADRKP